MTSDGVTKTVAAGMTAYLYNGANVGITQKGEEPLTLIISYPLASPAKQIIRMRCIRAADIGRVVRLNWPMCQVR